MMTGNKWDELVNGYDAMLTTNAGSNARGEFMATARPGGRGEVRFDGVQSIAQTPPLFVGSNQFTVAMWIFPTLAMGAGEYGALIVENTNRGLFYSDGTLNKWGICGHGDLWRGGCHLFADW
jgi:hypothetical protein